MTQPAFSNRQERDALLKDMFAGAFYNGRGEMKINLCRVFFAPEVIDKPESAAYMDEAAGELIKDCERTISQLSAYRAALAERYAYLTTAPTVPFVKLTRRRNCYDGLVYYYLTTGRRYIDTGAEMQESETKYPGRERRQAIADYNAYVKAHPGIDAVMNIAKPPHER